jgi:alpha-beta hydrolase superfamily lysophospholipase
MRGVGAALVLVGFVGGAMAGPAMAQQPLRIDGMVLWASGQTLTLQSDLPPATWYQIVGPYLIPVPGPRPTVTVDLHQLAQSDYAFLREGERVSVIGVVSSDRRRLIATSLIRGGEQQSP